MKSILCTISLFVGFLASAAATTVSGTVSLPVNVIAGSEGVEIEVRASAFVVDGSFGESRDIVVIPVGQSDVNYSFDIPEPPTSDTFRLRFECTLGCAGLGITTGGSWSTTSGVTGFLSATTFDSLVDNSVDILLESADIFSGVVNFPGGYIATGNESIDISVSDSRSFSFVSFSASSVLEAGATSLPFAIGVPNGNANGGWFVNVRCRGCGEPIVDEFSTQYTTTLQGNPLSLNEGDRFFYRINNDYRDLALTLIAIEEPLGSTANIVPILGLLLDE